MYQVGIVTLSDKGAKGERQDLSGPKIQELLPKDKYEVISYTMLPDDREKIRRELIRLSDEVKCDLILTTGGTGFSPRDITPEATMDVAERNAPGIAEGLQHAVYKKSNARKRCFCDTKRNADHQSSGKCQGSNGKYRVSDRKYGAWTGYSDADGQ